MLKKLVVLVLAALPLLIQPASVGAESGTGSLFAINGNEQLVKVDPSTGAFTLVTDLNTPDSPQSFDLASDPVIHRLYMIRAFVTFGADGFPIFHQNLLTVDSRTGAILSQPDLTGTAFPALMVDVSTGALFGFDQQNLVRIDPALGTSTVVARMTGFACQNSAALDSASGLVYLARESCGSIEEVTTQLFTINDSTGAISTGPTLDRPVRQIALDEGNVYGVTDGSAFDYVSIDKSTGATSVVTNLGDSSVIVQFGTATDASSHTTFVDVSSQDPPGSFNFVDRLVSVSDFGGTPTSVPLSSGIVGNGMAFESLIDITPASAVADVTGAMASGAIDSAGVGNSLLGLLADAAKASSQGKCKTAANIYKEFADLVRAQTGKHIAVATAGQLLMDARALSANCP